MVRLSAAQTMFGSIFVIVSSWMRPVAISLTFSTYCRRPTVSSAQATSLLSGLTAQSDSEKKLWPLAMAGWSNSMVAGAVALPWRRSISG